MSDVRWKVWLKDGTTRSSEKCAWADVPDGVLVVKQFAPEQWVVWGDGVYGEPGTWKGAGWTDDATFAATLAEAQAE